MEDGSIDMKALLLRRDARTLHRQFLRFPALDLAARVVAEEAVSRSVLVLVVLCGVVWYTFCLA
jgi:hypothetical protein